MVIEDKFVRATAIILQNHVEELFQAVTAIHDSSMTWVLNQSDLLLPSASEVKIQYENYLDLTVKSIDLRDILRNLQKVEEIVPAGIMIPTETGIIFPSVNPIMF